MFKFLVLGSLLFLHAASSATEVKSVQYPATIEKLHKYEIKAVVDGAEDGDRLKVVARALSDSGSALKPIGNLITTINSSGEVVVPLQIRSFGEDVQTAFFMFSIMKKSTGKYVSHAYSTIIAVPGKDSETANTFFYSKAVKNSVVLPSSGRDNGSEKKGAGTIKEPAGIKTPTSTSIHEKQELNLKSLGISFD